MTSSDIGIARLGSVTRPIVAITDVSASRSGTSAATSDRKTSSSMPNVSGIAISPASASMPPNIESSALSVLVPTEPT